MGWLVLSVNYRLSKTDWRKWVGGATFPDHLHDCMRAVAWAQSAEARRYGGGGEFLAVAGESAGGHLACLVGLTHQIPRMRPPDLMASYLRVDAVIDLYGVHSPKTNRNFRALFAGVVLKRSSKDEAHRESWNHASPLWWVQQFEEQSTMPAPPPFLIVHGTHDALVPIEDAREFAQALRLARDKCPGSTAVPDVYVEIPGANHGFNMTPSPLTYALTDTAVRFLGAVHGQTCTSKL